MFNNIYKDKKVLVTGHTGFKGTWLCLWLKILRAKVIGYSLEPNTKPSMFEALNLSKDLIHIVGDIRNEQNLLKIFQEYQPEIVFHLAAQPLVRLSYREPKETFETNAMGTVNLLECVRKTSSIKAIINITSDKCYENKEWVWGYRENDPMGGHDPYSASKGVSEIITSSYRNSFFCDNNTSIASARAGNVIGGGDWAEDRLIPDCIRALINNQTIEIRNPHATRPWQHVLEPLSGYLLLGSLLLQGTNNFSEAWNFGPSDNDILNVLNVTEQIISTWGTGECKILNNKNNLHEANLLKLDISKAFSRLKWRPVYHVHQAISETVNWYKEYYNNKSTEIYDFTLNQISNYVKEAQKYNIQWSLN